MELLDRRLNFGCRGRRRRCRRRCRWTAFFLDGRSRAAAVAATVHRRFFGLTSQSCQSVIVYGEQRRLKTRALLPLLI